jgi:predicted Zn finger-like uncharacterized protein
MYSQCPSCQARFRVNAGTLRAAHGRARCGHCGHEFDVLDHLSDDLPRKPGSPESGATDSRTPAATPPTLTGAPQADAEADPAGGTGPALEAAQDADLEAYHFSAEDIEKVFIDARDWQLQFGEPRASRSIAPPEPASVEHSDVVVEEPEGVEDITLEGLRVEIASDNGESLHLEAEFDGIDDEDIEEIDDLDSTSRLRTLENVPDSAYPEDEEQTPPKEGDETAFYRALIEGRELPDSVAPAAAVTSAAVATGASAPGPATTADAPMPGEIRATPAERWSRSRSVSVVEDELGDLDLTRAALPPRPGRGWLALGSVLLGLALAVQVTHYYRQDIARHPQAGNALRRAYALIGQPLSPNWDLDAFEVRQWGPTVDIAPGQPLIVRASLNNRADHAQPYPLLRLEFEDRFGVAVAQRDFMPAEYLKSPPQAVRQIAAGETIEAELSVVAPGSDAVGYTLDICLREEVSRIRCAHGDD